MTTYRCNVCKVYEYDSEKGDAALKVAAGPHPKTFPDGCRCPFCGSDSSHLQALD